MQYEKVFVDSNVLLSPNFDLNVPRTLVTLVMSKWHDNN